MERKLSLFAIKRWTGEINNLRSDHSLYFPVYSPRRTLNFRRAVGAGGSSNVPVSVLKESPDLQSKSEIFKQRVRAPFKASSNPDKR